MRHTDGSRAPVSLPFPAARPAGRAFTRRELLLISHKDRLKMAPADQVKFNFDRMMLESKFANRLESIEFAACAEFQAEKAEKRRRRKVMPAPV